MNEVESKSQYLLTHAVQVRASDIHFMPRREDVMVQYRIDDDLTEADKLPKRLAEKVISHFKFLAGMDIGEKRRPQNGALDLHINHHPVNLRLSTLPTPFNESLVLRLLPQDQSYTLSELSLFPQVNRELFFMMKRPGGLVLLTGPTGSGKTTLMYALLNAAVTELNRRVVTFEDPIEKKNDDFVQMQVNEKADLTYAQGFKSILRHDPDIIMIGEIRDAETAQIAVRAALTGHLVLSTVHTRDTISCVYRLLELGIPLSYLEQTLTGIVAQRLAGLICPYCGETCSGYCRMYRKKRRLGVHETLTGSALSSFLTSLKQTPDQPQIPVFEKLKDLITRGVALGFLSDQSYLRLVGDADEA